MQKRVVEPQADEARTESQVARAEPSRGAPDARTSKDYAIEFGGYLADAVMQYLKAHNSFDEKAAAGNEDVADCDLLNDCRRALINAVGEFRKRAARVEPEAGHVVLLEALRECVKQMEDAASLLEFFPDDYGEAMSLARAAIQQAERT